MLQPSANEETLSSEISRECIESLPKVLDNRIENQKRKVEQRVKRSYNNRKTSENII